MSSLLRKNKGEQGDQEKQPVKKIERKETTTPKNTFNPNSVFTVKPEKNAAKKAVEDKITSVRVKSSNQIRLNAIVMNENLDSVDQALDNILNIYESSLSAENKKHLDMIVKILSKK